MSNSLHHIPAQSAFSGRRRAWALLLLMIVAGIVFLVAQPTVSYAVTDEDFESGLFDENTDSAEIEYEEPPSLGGMMIKLALALGVVFGLMWLVLWLARRFMPQSMRQVRGSGIDILSSRALGQRKHLMVVRARDKTLLLGVTPQAIQMLSELDQEMPAWPELTGDEEVESIESTEPLAALDSMREGR